jgi:hypothetical protein
MNPPISTLLLVRTRAREEMLANLDGVVKTSLSFATKAFPYGNGGKVSTPYQMTAPVTYALPAESTAIPNPRSSWLPPK